MDSLLDNVTLVLSLVAIILSGLTFYWTFMRPARIVLMRPHSVGLASIPSVWLSTPSAWAANPELRAAGSERKYICATLSFGNTGGQPSFVTGIFLGIRTPDGRSHGVGCSEATADELLATYWKLASQEWVATPDLPRIQTGMVAFPVPPGNSVYKNVAFDITGVALPAGTHPVQFLFTLHNRKPMRMGPSVEIQLDEDLALFRHGAAWSTAYGENPIWFQTWPREGVDS